MNKVNSLIIALFTAAGITAVGYVWASLVTMLWTWIGFSTFGYILFIMNMICTLLAALLAGYIAYQWATTSAAADQVSALGNKASSMFAGLRAKFN